MTRSEQDRNSGFARLAGMAGLLILLVTAVPAAQAQTYQVIHNFTGKADGSDPVAGLTMDRAGNLYGASLGNSVFRMTHAGSNWVFYTLFNFPKLADGPHCGTSLAAGNWLLSYGVTFQTTPLLVWPPFDVVP